MAVTHTHEITNRGKRILVTKNRPGHGIDPSGREWPLFVAKGQTDYVIRRLTVDRNDARPTELQIDGFTITQCGQLLCIADPSGFEVSRVPRDWIDQWVKTTRPVEAEVERGGWTVGPPTAPGYYAVHVPLDEHRVAERIVRLRQVDIEANAPQTNNANISDIIIHFPLPDPPEPKSSAPPPPEWTRVETRYPGEPRQRGWAFQRPGRGWTVMMDSGCIVDEMNEVYVTVIVA